MLVHSFRVHYSHYEHFIRYNNCHDEACITGYCKLLYIPGLLVYIDPKLNGRVDSQTVEMVRPTAGGLGKD